MVIMNNQIFKVESNEQLAEVLKSSLAITSQEQAQPANPLLTRDICELLSFNKQVFGNIQKSGRLKSYGIGNRLLQRDEVLEAVKPNNPRLWKV
jgi:hypothetical protein